MTEATTLLPIRTLAAVPVTGTAGLSDPIVAASYRTQIVRVRSTVDTCLSFSATAGTDPDDATEDDLEIGANQHEYFEVPSGTKISAIRATSAVSDGVLKITLCDKR